MMSAIKLNNGYTFPLLGLGTWKSKTGEVTNAVKTAISCGYRHIDCAQAYQNEEEIGIALKEKLSDGTVNRSDLFITSKVWNTFHKRDLVIKALKESLSKLGLDYLDLYLMHWPMGFKEGDSIYPTDESGNVLPSESHFTETWKGLEDCVKQGLAKSIGLANFNSKQIEEILKIAEIKPANNQVECHPYLNQSNLIEFCRQRGITITAYSPLGSPDRPMVRDGDPVLLEDSTLNSIAKKYKKNPGQILIRYQIQREVAVIPKSVNEGRIQSNFDVFNFTISAEDMQLLNSLNRNFRLIKFEAAKSHPDYPFSIEF